MDILFKKQSLVIGVYLAASIAGMAGLATQVEAAPEAGQAVASVTNETPANGELAQRVTAALHADPYAFDRHVTVSVENGAIALRGFVLSEVDLQQLLSDARKVAGNRPVVDYLSITEYNTRR